MKNYDQLIDSALVELESCETLISLEELRLEYFGKNGEVTSILKSLSKLSEKDLKPPVQEKSQCFQAEKDIT